MLMAFRDELEIDDDVDDDVDDDWRRRMVRRAQAFARPDCVAQRMVTELEACILTKHVSIRSVTDTTIINQRRPAT